MPESGSFLPTNLRPAPRPLPRRRHAPRQWVRATIVLVLCCTAGLLVSYWRIRAVEATPCAGIPSSVVAGLEEYEGRWIPLVSLDRIRRDIERWPGVASVVVELEPPWTLRIEATADRLCGSVAVGPSWRGVDCRGNLSLRLQEPIPPVLENFELDRNDMISALRAADRFRRSGAEVAAIRKITPLDFEMTITTAETNGVARVRVLPQGTEAERWWIAALTRGDAPAWADLRFDRRVVVRRAG